MLRAAARTFHESRVSTDAEIDIAFKTIAEQRIGAIVITAGPFFDTRRKKLVTLASHYAVPAMYHFREFPVAGGLISYGIDSRVTYRQIGVYAGAILKGEARHSSPRLPSASSPSAAAGFTKVVKNNKRLAASAPVPGPIAGAGLPGNRLNISQSFRHTLADAVFLAPLTLLAVPTFEFFSDVLYWRAYGHGRWVTE
jgi:hypothetical protein